MCTRLIRFMHSELIFTWLRFKESFPNFLLFTEFRCYRFHTTLFFYKQKHYIFWLFSILKIYGNEQKCMCILNYKIFVSEQWYSLIDLVFEELMWNKSTYNFSKSLIMKCKWVMCLHSSFLLEKLLWSCFHL